MFGGPPGIGCCCSGGGIGREGAAADGSPGCCSKSSHSVLKSPELNLWAEKQNLYDSRLHVERKLKCMFEDIRFIDDGEA